MVSRTNLPESLALEVEYWGSCHDFAEKVKDTVTINAYRGCLPVQVHVATNPDYNDYNTHWFCTNIDEDRSIVHFVEVYTTVNPNPSGAALDENTGSETDFVVSFIPDAPFRVITEHTSLARKPSCQITRDYCNSTNAVIANCEPAGIDHHRERKNVVVNHDRIYITSDKKVSLECKGTDGKCCAYITPNLSNFGGICPHDASKEVNHFRHREEHHQDDDHRHHDEEEHRHHNNDDDDEHRHGRPGDNRRPGDNGRPGDRPGEDRRPGEEDRFDGRPGDRPGGRPFHKSEEEEKKRIAH